MRKLVTWSRLTMVRLCAGVLPVLLVTGLALVVTGTAFVPDVAAQSDDSPRLTVLAEALNVRVGPGVTYPTVGLLTQGVRQSASHDFDPGAEC